MSPKMKCPGTTLGTTFLLDEKSRCESASLAFRHLSIIFFCLLLILGSCPCLWSAHFGRDQRFYGYWSLSYKTETSAQGFAQLVFCRWRQTVPKFFTAFILRIEIVDFFVFFHQSRCIIINSSRLDDAIQRPSRVANLIQAGRLFFLAGKPYRWKGAILFRSKTKALPVWRQKNNRL